MTKIAITMRRDYFGDYQEPRDSLSCDWIQFLNLLKIQPILIPNSLKDPVGLFKESKCEGLLLSNGSDVNLKLIDGNFTGQDRDITESKLLKYAIDSNIPVLGVCRGMQFINIFFGGKVKKINQHVGIQHKVDVKSKFFKEYLNKEKFTVNSYHNLALDEHFLPTELVSWAISNDKNIEGIYHRNLNILGIQWHPERDVVDDLNIKIIESVFLNMEPIWKMQP